MVTSDPVHALAQLPDRVSLEFEADAEALDRIRPVGAAYAIDDRISLTQGPRGDAAWRFEGASPAAPEWARHGSLEDRSAHTLGEIVESLWPGEESPAPSQNDDRILSGHRVAIVTNLPTHYRVPLFAGLSERLTASGASLRVFFGGTRAHGRSWLSGGGDLNFDHEFLRSVRVPVRRRRAPLFPLDVRGRLATFDPTIILASGFSPFSTPAVVSYARRRRVPFGIWSGETPFHAPRGRRWALRTAQRRKVTGQAAFGIAYGSLAARYLATIAPRLPVVIGRNTSVAAVTRSNRDEAGPIELVAVADLAVPGKGIETVVQALALSRELPCRLTVIGGWPAKGSPLSTAAERDPRVRFLGPLPHDQVMEAYRKSDLFLFPTRVDPFGLALVEAMASELAAIVSPAAGAVADLGVSGHNCLVADVDDPRSWADRITTLVNDEQLRRSLGRRALETIDRRWRIAHAVEGMTAGLRLGALASAGER